MINIIIQLYIYIFASFSHLIIDPRQCPAVCPWFYGLPYNHQATTLLAFLSTIFYVNLCMQMLFCWWCLPESKTHIHLKKTAFKSRGRESRDQWPRLGLELGSVECRRQIFIGSSENFEHFISSCKWNFL